MDTNDLLTKVESLEKQTGDILLEKDMTFEKAIKKYKTYLVSYLLIFGYLIIVRPNWIKSKKIVRNKIEFSLDMNKLFMWQILLSGMSSGIIYYVQNKNAIVL